MIPTAEAALQEQELAETGSDEALKREKREALIATYRGAIELGSRNPDLVRRTVALLLASGRSLEAVQLMGQVPVAPQLGNDLMRLAASAAGSQDDQQAAQVAQGGGDRSAGDSRQSRWPPGAALAGQYPRERQAR